MSLVQRFRGDRAKGVNSSFGSSAAGTVVVEDVRSGGVGLVGRFDEL